MFMPEKGAGGADLLATSSDYLRLYTIDDTQQGNSSVEVKSILSNSSNSEFCAPLTSFDWNEDDLNKIGTSSIDTTCTIWDLEKEVVDTQLIAHDREVYDFAWGGAGVFASVSADGSVRVFDLRWVSLSFSLSRGKTGQGVRIQMMNSFMPAEQTGWIQYNCCLPTDGPGGPPRRASKRMRTQTLFAVVATFC